jgi:hypothetical protein
MIWRCSFGKLTWERRDVDVKLTPEELNELTSSCQSQQVRFLLLRYVDFVLSLLYLNPVNNVISTSVVFNKSTEQIISIQEKTSLWNLEWGLCGEQIRIVQGFDANYYTW